MFSILWDHEAGAGDRSKVSSLRGQWSTGKVVHTSRWVWVSGVPYVHAVRDYCFRLAGFPGSFFS